MSYTNDLRAELRARLTPEEYQYVLTQLEAGIAAIRLLIARDPAFVNLWFNRDVPQRGTDLLSPAASRALATLVTVVRTEYEAAAAKIGPGQLHVVKPCSEY